MCCIRILYGFVFSSWVKKKHRMKYFDLIIDECKRINEVLIKQNDDFYFANASQSRITYGFNLGLLIFRYDPERYEYGSVMVLKGLHIKFNHDTEKEYPVSEALSFLQNNCKEFKTSPDTLSLEEHLKEFNSFINLVPKYENWNELYKKHLKSIDPWE